MKRRRMSKRSSRREFRHNVGKIDGTALKLYRGGTRL